MGGFAQYVNGRIKTARIKGRALEHVELPHARMLLGQLFFVRIQHGKSFIRQNTGQDTEICLIEPFVFGVAVYAQPKRAY